MSELEKEVLSDISKMIRLSVDRPLPPPTIFQKIVDVVAGSAIMAAAAWWIATIIS